MEYGHALFTWVGASAPTRDKGRGEPLRSLVLCGFRAGVRARLKSPNDSKKLSRYLPVGEYTTKYCSGRKSYARSTLKPASAMSASIC